MCNCTDVVWIGQPDVNERFVSREAPESTILVQWYERATHHGFGVRACDTPRGATHHGVDVEKRAVENKGAGVKFQ